jgi:hypothetical protein
MKEIVTARWRDLVLREGGTQRDCETIETIERAFVYPGFEFDPKTVLA